MPIQQHLMGSGGGGGGPVISLGPDAGNFLRWIGAGVFFLNDPTDGDMEVGDCVVLMVTRVYDSTSIPQISFNGGVDFNQQESGAWDIYTAFITAAELAIFQNGNNAVEFNRDNGLVTMAVFRNAGSVTDASSSPSSTGTITSAARGLIFGSGKASRFSSTTIPSVPTVGNPSGYTSLSSTTGGGIITSYNPPIEGSSIRMSYREDAPATSGQSVFFSNADSVALISLEP